MPITVLSACGRSFPLKDELAGKLVTCPDCGENLRVPGGSEAPAPSRFPGLDPAFSRKKFLLRQKHMAISEKYYVWDEAGKTVMFVQRPAHFLKGLVAALGGLATLIGVIVAFVALSSLMGKEAGGAVMVAGFFVALAAMIVVIILLAPKRHVFFYRDDTAKELLLKVDQDQQFAPIVATYTVRDPAGTILAVLRKNYLYNIFRKRWYVLSPAGAILSVIKEDSIILSLLRRVLGPALGLLRTNFVFFKGESDHPIGEFNRKFTLLDRYVLDLTHDVDGHLDPRLAVAAGVMLDTGERR
jgi:uncharacterized protein YxjI